MYVYMYIYVFLCLREVTSHALDQVWIEEIVVPPQVLVLVRTDGSVIPIIVFVVKRSRDRGLTRRTRQARAGLYPRTTTG